MEEENYSMGCLTRILIAVLVIAIPYVVAMFWDYPPGWAAVLGLLPLDVVALIQVLRIHKKTDDGRYVYVTYQRWLFICLFVFSVVINLYFLVSLVSD